GIFEHFVGQGQRRGPRGRESAPQDGDRQDPGHGSRPRSRTVQRADGRRPTQRTGQRIRGINPCSVPGYGTPEGTFWVDTPEMGLGCAYVKNGKTTLVVTVASGAPISYGQFTENNGTKGYMVSSSDGNMAIYVWLAGSGSSTER